MNTPNSAGSGLDMFSLLSGENAELVANPFPLMGTDHQAWMVTRMEEAVQVLKEQGSFRVDPSSIGITNPFGRNTTETSDVPTFFTSQTMLTVDEPDHRRLRLLVSKAFTPRYIESLRPRVQEIADTLLNRVQEQGQMELVKDYAFPLPINVIAEMLGIPESDWGQIRLWSQALAQGLSVGGRDPGVDAHMHAFGEYTARLVADKRQHPGNALISQMIAIEEAVLGRSVAVVPDDLPFDIAALNEPMAVARHAVNRSNPHPGDKAVVFGAGPIGLGAAIGYKSLGVEHVVVVDIVPARLQRALAVGADAIINSAEEDVRSRLFELHGTATDGIGQPRPGTDIYLDAAGVPAVIDTIMACAKHRATVCIPAVHKKPVPVDFGQILATELVNLGIM